MQRRESHFGSEYREHATARNGQVVTLRTVQPTDKDMLARALSHLSPHSRYLRFFCNKSQFTAAELRYLTELDGQQHFALAAVRAGANGDDDGLGIARFVRLVNEPTVAEAAVAVVDEMQRQGLGKLLFLRLAAAARERGIERIRSEILPENVAIRALIRELVPDAKQHQDGQSIIVEAALPAVGPAEDLDLIAERGTTYRLLALAAGDALQLRQPGCAPEPHQAPAPAAEPVPPEGSSGQR